MTNILVTNNYADASGATPSGTVSFTPVMSATDGSSFRFLADPIFAPVVSGVLAVSLLTTDSFVVDGTVTYRVVERVGASLRARYYVDIPSSLGASVVLSTLSTTSTPPNTFVISGGGDLTAELTAIDARLDILEAESAGDLSAHEAASNPHPTYLTEAEADLLYADITHKPPAGGLTGQVLSKINNSDYQFQWVNQSATAITSPFTVTADAVGETPITAQGMAGQTGKVFAARLDGGTQIIAATAGGQVEVGNSPPADGALRIEQKSASERALKVKMKATPTADAIQVVSSTDVTLMKVDSTGAITAPNIGNPVLILDNAASVPAGTLSGTLIVRRPA